MRRNLQSGRVLWVLVGLAFLLRLGFMAATGSLGAAPQEDELDYSRLAQSLLAGQGYSLDGVPVVNRAPAYPVFLALIYSVVGVQPWVARVVQAALLAGTVLLVYYIGKRGWGGEVGLLAAFFFAVYPFSIFWGRYLITENLLVVLFAGAAALLVCPLDAGWFRLPAAGVLMGTALLTRPTALPVVMGIIVWLAMSMRGRGRLLPALALFVAGVVVAMLPWIARNYALYGQFIPFTSGYGSSAGGYVFWISNNEYTAQPGEQWGRYVAADLLPEYSEYTQLPNDPTLLDRKGYEYGLRFLAAHPGEVPVLLLGKFLRFWNVFPGAQFYTKAAGALVLLLLPSFLLGLREVWRRPQNGGMLVAFIVGTLLVGLIFWADTRTRVPADPFILLTAAVGSAGFLAARRQSKGDRRLARDG